MDQAVLRQRRAARQRQVRQRRRAVLAGALVVIAGLVAAFTAFGGQGSAPDRTGARQVATPAQPPPPAPIKPAKTPARPRLAPLVGARRGPHEAVPILMYHVIGKLLPGTANPSLWVSPAAFAAHVAALKRAGYHAITLQRAWNAWHHDGLLPSKPVVLSFDDGYLGQVLYALPTLAKVGWPGVLNLKLGNMADMGGTKAVRRMVHAGWEVDSHTLTHPDLRTVGTAQLHDEVVVSRARLKRYFGEPVNFFCYPSGHYDATVIAEVKRAGYLAATTTQLGWATPAADPFTLPRVRVDGGMTAAAVLQRLHDTRTATGGA
jgi:peptidoglycan/xylan/chitin deacetylase (PgdA/CDA1 family)